MILIPGLHFFELLTKQVQKHSIMVQYKKTSSVENLKKIILPFSIENSNFKFGDEIIFNHNEYDIIKIQNTKKHVILYVFEDKIETALLSYSNKNTKGNKKSNKFYFQKIKWDCTSFRPKVFGDNGMKIHFTNSHFQISNIFIPTINPPPKSNS